MANHQLPATPKVPTGVDGLDQILQGGLPEGRTTLIIGGPGAGKSLLGLEFLCRRLRLGTCRDSGFGAKDATFVNDPPGIKLLAPRALALQGVNHG